MKNIRPIAKDIFVVDSFSMDKTVEIADIKTRAILF
jgi:hypothetical protein